MLATLARPRWWVLSLAAFLVRGGVVLVIVPVVALPSIAGLAASLGPILVGFVFGEPSAAALILTAAVVVALAAWLAVSANVGAWLDIALAAEAASDEDLVSPRPSVGRPPARRAAAARLLAHLPTAVAVAFAASRIADAGYQEFIQPGDAAIPLILRVAGRAPEAVAALAITTLVGEAAGGVAVRRLMLGASVPAAVAHGFAKLAQPAGLVTFLLTDAVIAAVGLPFWAAVSMAWDDARIALVDGATGTAAALPIGLFLVTWLAGLWILAVAVAWRATAWSAEVFRTAPARRLVRQAEVTSLTAQTPGEGI
ncbi:MAG TPA: hypothetical protein VEX41_04590 [Candidatus Eisenbacteria bacterium]|nr:hypothetical protein [Candidatus Eisenbacteria bacterium]